MHVYSRTCGAVLSSIVQNSKSHPVGRYQSPLVTLLREHRARLPWSISALSKTNWGLLPPSSRETFFRLLFAADSIILRPVIVDPVKATLSISGCRLIAAPPTDPSEGMVLSTPGGNLTMGAYHQLKMQRSVTRTNPASFASSESFCNRISDSWDVTSGITTYQSCERR